VISLIVIKGFVLYILENNVDAYKNLHEVGVVYGMVLHILISWIENHLREDHKNELYKGLYN
jgi:hypothetical protein